MNKKEEDLLKNRYKSILNEGVILMNETDKTANLIDITVKEMKSDKEEGKNYDKSVQDKAEKLYKNNYKFQLLTTTLSNKCNALKELKNILKILKLELHLSDEDRANENKLFTADTTMYEVVDNKVIEAEGYENIEKFVKQRVSTNEQMFKKMYDNI